jgi:hypothetical protein
MSRTVKVKWRRYTVAALLGPGVVVVAALAFLPGAASACTCTATSWNGIGASGLWSDGTAWGNGTGSGITGNAGFLLFGRLPDKTGCNSNPYPVGKACYGTRNDQTTAVEGLGIDLSGTYRFDGRALQLGQQGIDAEGSGAWGSAAFSMPLQFIAPQYWTIANGNFQFQGGPFDQNVAPAIDGQGNAWDVTVGHQGLLDLSPSSNGGPNDNISTGTATFHGSGSASGVHASDNGWVGIAGSFNAVNGNPVRFDNVAFGGSGQLGPLTTSGADMVLTVPIPPGFTGPAPWAVYGDVALDSMTNVSVLLTDGSSALSSEQLVTRAAHGQSGTINVAGASLTLLLDLPGFGGIPNQCATGPPTVGHQTTLIRAVGGLTGTFAGVPDGAVVATTPVSSCTYKSYVRINYTATDVTATVVGGAPPVNAGAPSVSGTAQQGQTLTVVQGSWTDSTSVTDSWQDCDVSGANCSTVGTGPSYVLGAGDVGHTVRVLETASNANGPASPVASAGVGPVTAASIGSGGGGSGGGGTGGGGTGGGGGPGGGGTGGGGPGGGGTGGGGSGGGGAVHLVLGAPVVSVWIVTVPVSCTGTAAGPCVVTLKLTTVETLTGSKLVALTAGPQDSHARHRHRNDPRRYEASRENHAQRRRQSAAQVTGPHPGHPLADPKQDSDQHQDLYLQGTEETQTVKRERGACTGLAD